MAFMPIYYSKFSKAVPTPSGFGKYTERANQTVIEADYYVSPSGNDSNDGSLASPFASIEKARNTVRTLNKTGKKGITVAIAAGEYRVSQIEFTAEDSGTAECPITYCAYGDGEVILNGGMTLPSDSFMPVTDDAMLLRLSDAAKNNVVCLKLSDCGITVNDFGKLYTIGMYSTAARYDGDYVGELYSEVFFNDTRMTLARYPDTGDWLYTRRNLS